MAGRKASGVSELLSAMLLLSLTTVASLAVLELGSTRAAIATRMLEEASEPPQLVDVDVLAVGGKYVVIVSNPSADPVKVDAVVIDGRLASGNTTLQPGNPLILVLGGRPESVAVVVGGEIYEP